MKRLVLFLLVVLTSSVYRAQADEGMWLLPLLEKLNMSEMRELGFELTAEDIYSINNSSIKDAIVIFGGGCTGEIVSDEGLLFTNHHCGYDEIQNHSTVEHDYLKDGFWAMSREDELPNPDLSVLFLRRIEEVTDKVIAGFTEDMGEADRLDKLKEISGELEKEAGEEGKYEARVRSFFAGNKYYLFVYEEYHDVRLVGAPPSSIGKFGFDTDNWEWPRHTGDFSIFRVYTAPDGSPAVYAEDNIPLKPKYSLPVSLAGVEKGDFAFILGFPGSTDRYLSSYGIEETMDVTNATRIKVRGVRQEILMEDMMADQAINIMYASKYSRSSNYWKYSIGQNKGLRRLKVIEKKRAEEEAFMEWVEADSARQATYGGILDEMQDIYTKKKEAERNFAFLGESFFRATEIIDFISDFQYLYMLLQNEETNPETLDAEVKDLRKSTEDFFAEYNQSTDEKVAASMFSLYAKEIPAGEHPDIYAKINSKYKGDYQKFTGKLFKSSFFVSPEEVMEFLDDPSVKSLEKDMGFETMNSIFRKYFEAYRILDEYDTRLSSLERLYMKARMEQYPDKVFYPDANFTMRLTYGIVDDYSPRDAVHYDYITYLEGVLEKEDPENFEFEVSPRLKELYHKKEFGRYDEDGRLPLCFITNNDITGGNSGSPVLNSKGELIGLAFDGNWEAMSGDIAFEPELQRCIVVDIRYVLFVIDIFAGADHLIDELNIVE